MENVFDVKHMNTLHRPFFLMGNIAEKNFGFDYVSKYIYQEIEDYQTNMKCELGPRVSFVHCIKMFGKKLLGSPMKTTCIGPATMFVEVKIFQNEIKVIFTMIRKTNIRSCFDIFIFGKKNFKNYMIAYFIKFLFPKLVSQITQKIHYKFENDLRII